MQLSAHASVLQIPVGSCRRKAGRPDLRLVAAAACLGLLGWGGMSIDRWLGQQAGLLRCRMAMQDLGVAVRAMRAQAMAKGHPVQLHIDVLQRAFRMAVLQTSAHPYHLPERTIWLPQTLEISEAPAVLTALPTGELSSGSIIITAPSHNKRFRLTTSQRGTVELHEESTL